MMKAIIDCHWESDDKLEVETWENTEIIIRSVVDGTKVGIALDKKRVVGLIQILAECLMEID